MNRVVLTCAAASMALLAACGGSEVVVQAQIEGPDGQPVALRDLPVRALPYDRDALFDSLRAAYAVPEPEIPADMMTLRDSIAAAREQWVTAEQQWGVARDTLQKLRARLDRLNRASGEYVVLFREYGGLETQYNAAERTMKQSFDRMTALQRGYNTRADSLKLAREQWGDAAYADVQDIIAGRLRAERLQEYADTTDGNGIARFRGLKKRQWWIHARYDLPLEELYWNVPVTMEGGQVQVQLTRQTAQVRPKL